jgi:hypothetical protein
VRLTIVGGDRERPACPRRGREKTVCARGACAALLGGPSTSPLGAMRVLAGFVLLVALVACGSSPALKDERVQVWERKLAQELHVGMSRGEVQAWGDANHLRFHEQHWNGKTDLAASDQIPGRFSLLTGCAGWAILIYVFLDDADRMTGSVVHSGSVCL